MTKGKKFIGQSKRTSPPPYFLKTFSKLELLHLQIAKTLLTTKGRTILGGAFYLVKGKAFKNGGESFKT
jgi:hypothetical protein